MSESLFNVNPSELAHFGALASRWWGKAVRLRVSSGRSRTAERTAMDGRAGAARHGRLEATAIGRGA